MKLGLTGPIGCGKSTWLRAELARRGIELESLAGFCTRWHGDRGRGVLELADWRGNVLWSASGPFGRLVPLAADFAAAVRVALNAAPPGVFLAIDELGVLEARDDSLRHAVAAALSRAPEAIVVVQQRALPLWRDLLALDDWRILPPLPSSRG